MQATQKKQIPQKRNWRRWILFGLSVIVISLNGIGLFGGDVVYEEVSVLHSHMNEKNMEAFKSQLKDSVAENQIEDVTLDSRFGYSLRGTYIRNSQVTDKTLVFLHGFAENRAAGMNYLDIYLNQGFNVLLVDSRAHGKSGGDSVTWGNYEKYDLDTWVDWVQKRFPQGEIGIHGISMGAATALLHAELNETSKRVRFYVADSSYSDFETLLAMKMEQYFPKVLLPQLLLPYANIAAYWNSRFTFYQASPIRSVANVTTPVLYLHGEADKVVPPYMSQKLYEATKGPRQIYTFPQAAHVAGVFEEHSRYSAVVQNFVRFAEGQS